MITYAMLAIIIYLVLQCRANFSKAWVSLSIDATIDVVVNLPVALFHVPDHYFT